jgi:hypothetical protein
MMEGRMNLIPNLSRAVEAIGAQNKAILSGAFVATPAVDTLLYAGLAWAGLGQMPSDAALIDAIRQLLWGVVAWAGVYMVPNLTRNSGE